MGPVIFQAPICVSVPTQNPKFDNGGVNGRFLELDWNQTNAIAVGHD